MHPLKLPALFAHGSNRNRPARKLYRQLTPPWHLPRRKPLLSLKSSGASGVCWRAFTGSRWPRCASRSSRSRLRSSCAGCCAGSMSLPDASLRRTRNVGGAASVAGIRNSGQRLGATDPVAPHRRLRSQMARPALPDGRSGLGKVVAASGDAGFFYDTTVPKAHRFDSAASFLPALPHHVLRARRSRLDDPAASWRRAAGATTA